MPGVVLVEKPGYPKSLNLTLNGYIPLTSARVTPILVSDAFEYSIWVTEELNCSKVVTFSTGIINSRMDQLRLQLL